MTELEYMNLNNTITKFLINDLSLVCWNDPELFINKYKEELDLIGYSYVNTLVKGNNKFDIFSLFVDELSFFLNIYKNTMRI